MPCPIKQLFSPPYFDMSTNANDLHGSCWTSCYEFHWNLKVISENMSNLHISLNCNSRRRKSKSMNEWMNQSINQSTINLSNSAIPSLASAKNLVVIFDDTLSLSLHFTNICRVATFYLWRINHIWRFMTMQATKTLVHFPISSHVDYCNFFLMGPHALNLAKIRIFEFCCPPYLSDKKRVTSLKSKSSIGTL